jgi:hypothetical protein
MDNPDCYTPPNKEMPCSISIDTRRACKNQCLQENYSNGDCYTYQYHSSLDAPLSETPLQISVKKANKFHVCMSGSNK